MVSGADAASNGNVLVSSLSEAIRAGISCGISCPRTDRACIFGCDPVSLAGEIVSDLADCRSSSPVPCISDLRVPGWVDEGVIAIVIGDTCARAMSEELASRGCRTVAIVRSVEGIDGMDAIQIPDGLGFAGASPLWTPRSSTPSTAHPTSMPPQRHAGPRSPHAERSRSAESSRSSTTTSWSDGPIPMSTPPRCPWSWSAAATGRASSRT